MVQSDSVQNELLHFVSYYL